MKKILLLLMLSGISAFAQERSMLKGKITSLEEAVENVHIRNVTTRQFSVSDQQGLFRMTMTEGDTLLFTHITMQDLVKVISGEELAAGFISIEMLPRDNELEEVVLEDSPITALSLGIISEKKEIPTINERRLQTAGDFKWYHLFGLIGSLELDPILNAINGRTRKLKRNIQIEQKMEQLQFLNENYLDFMKENFEATEAEVQRFWDHLVEQEGLKAAMDGRNVERLKFYLTDQWFKYRENLEE